MRLAAAILVILLWMSAVALALGEQNTGVTTTRVDQGAYLEPIAGLSPNQKFQFERGRIGFFARWVVFPSLGGEWGLGPLFNAEGCGDCHINGGRAPPPAGPEDVPMATIARLSIPGTDETGAPKPDPNYGGQIQTLGLMGVDPRAHGHGERVRPEADVNIIWTETTFTYPDGAVARLRAPQVSIDALEYGALHADVQIGLRHAQPIFGLGLLEAVPEETIRSLEARQAEWGLSGRVNMVWDMRAGGLRLGRFGWKANQPSVRQQIETAFHGDISVTSEFFELENCTPVQADCLAQPPGNQPELIAKDSDHLEFWTLALAAPARRNANNPAVLAGEELFNQIGCAGCHRVELKTGDHPILPLLANQTIAAYTDLLVHDLGKGLCSERTEFEAGPCDWRTQALWGIGLAGTVGTESYLHDGRARTLEEAILWHDGEAEPSRNHFAGLPAKDRVAVMRFLGSL